MTTPRNQSETVMNVALALHIKVGLDTPSPPNLSAPMATHLQGE
jgi:hypothetical protein